MLLDSQRCWPGDDAVMARRGGPKNPDALKETFGLVRVSFTGIEEIDKKIRELNTSLQKKALRKATRRVAKFTLQLMKKEIPHNSGFLESQLKVKAKKRSRKYPQTVGVTVGFPDDLFKGDTFYAGFLEFGTEQRQTKAKANRGRIEQGRWDFMRVSLWSFIEQKQQMFREEILKWLREQQAKGTV